jgi:hypothetical protein
MTEFDIKFWVKKYFGLSPNAKNLDETNNSLGFVWLWSIFESEYLKDSRTNKPYNEQLIELSTSFPVSKIGVDGIYGFLHNRYFQHGETTTFYKNLKFDPQLSQQLRAILQKTKPLESEKLKFVLLVIFKFRCNLFHGRKDPLLWNRFDKVFYQINRFLSEFLDLKLSPKYQRR